MHAFTDVATVSILVGSRHLWVDSGSLRPFRIMPGRRALWNVDEGQGAGRRGELAVNSDGERKSR